MVSAESADRGLSFHRFETARLPPPKLTDD